MRKQIYQAICEAIKEKNPDVMFLDLWNDNITDLNGGKVWPTPAVFVEFEQIDWRQGGNGVRRGDVPIRLHIVTKAFPSNGSNDLRQEKTLEYFGLIDRINATMQGLRGKNFSGFMLTTSATNHDHAELIESVERYITSAQDTSAVDPNIIKATVPNLAVKA